jgi:hypothetical protein
MASTRVALVANDAVLCLGLRVGTFIDLADKESFPKLLSG